MTSKNEVAVQKEQDLMLTLKTSLYPGATDEAVGLVLAYCRSAHLDPMQKPVHIVPIWDGKLKQERDVVMPGIGLYRIQAARSGEYAGMTDPEFGEDVTEQLGGTNITYPVSCKITVKRLLPGGAIAEFSATERWKENYATKGKMGEPNSMWAKRPYGQLAKCAEAQALRKAFPEIGSQPTAEEMEGEANRYREEDAPAHEADTLDQYPAEQFNKLLPVWGKLVESGKKTAKEIIATLETKGLLTNEQCILIERFEPINVEEENADA